jgi:hypothetical protein
MIGSGSSGARKRIHPSGLSLAEPPSGSSVMITRTIVADAVRRADRHHSLKCRERTLFAFEMVIH